MPELLVELLSEEIPARMQTRAAEDLARLAGEQFAAARLTHATLRSFAGPRRLTLVVDGLPERQPDLTEERKGPRIDAPPSALNGFLNSTGLSLEQLEQRDIGKARFYFATVQRAGRATADVLPELLALAIAGLNWPKSMRWAGHRLTWVRPLHSALAIFDGKPLAGGIAIDAATTLPFGTSTVGHRFMAPGPIKVTDFVDYAAKLRAAFVMVDAADRKQVIAAEIGVLAGQEALEPVPDEALLSEVAGLVEWPVPLLGSIDHAFMDLPPEVLRTVMRAHQKYFALRQAEGDLAPRFIVVANLRAEDGGAAIVAGNERVLRARLADARFFWDQDRKTRLEAHVAQLADIVFHARLGTVAQKVERIELLAGEIAAHHLRGADIALARRAGRLAKADLVTGMVGEFPELQGIMGRYYARHDGEPEPVAQAIAEHYAPLGPGDRCPNAPTSVAVALADKLDTLVGFFAIGETPTGSKDPFALRRAALGVIRLILENKLRLKLTLAFDYAAHLYLRQDIAAVAAGLGAQTTVPAATAAEEMQRDRPFFRMDDLLAFFADRLKVYLREQGVRHDLITAVFAAGADDDLVRLIGRVQALSGFLASDDGANLLTAYRRAANILRIEERKDGVSYATAPEAGALAEPEEIALHRVLGEAEDGVRSMLGQDRFDDAMRLFASLRQPVDAFFDRVTVNCDEPPLRMNRLRLLAAIRRTADTVADFAKVEG